jgi:hypothetical protein
VCARTEGQWDEVVTKAFATPLVWGLHHDKQRGEEEKVDDEDSWAARNDAWTSLSTLQLGPLKHVATEQELDTILAATCTHPLLPRTHTPAD